MKKLAYYNRRNYKREYSFEKESKLPSETIPDMTLSMRELVDRHTRGMEVRTYKVAYDSDFEEEYPDISKMSKMERVELAKEHAEHVMEKQQELSSKRAKRQKQIKASSDAVKQSGARAQAASDEDIITPRSDSEEGAPTKSDTKET